MSKKSIDGLYNSIELVINEARNNIYRAANFAMVHAYWNIGRLILDDRQHGDQRAEYGKAVLQELSNKLTLGFGKSFSSRNLRHMRQFYIIFPNWNAVRSELSWTHYRQLLKIKKEDARKYYMHEAAENRWSTRTLERQINTLYYERILNSDKKGKELVKTESEENKIVMQPMDIIKDPYMLDFLMVEAGSNLLEKELEQALIDNLQKFLLELGKGFAFVDRQHRISIEDDHYYVDLVFYNYILKCFVLVDLKTTKLTHQDLGQMDMYMRYFEDVKKQIGDDSTIGLILCADKNNTMAKYSLLNDSKSLFASKYKTQLPSEDEMMAEIERGRHQLELENKLSK